MTRIIRPGGSTGDVLATAISVLSSGTAYYVDSVTGDSGNSGLSEQDPFASITSAVSAAGTEDLIFLLPTHTETLGAQLALSQQTTIVGIGASGGAPSPTIDTGLYGIAASGDDIHIRNVNLTATLASAVPLAVTGDRFTLAGCKMSLPSVLNTINGMTVAASVSNTSILDCTFLSTAVRDATPSLNSPPQAALVLAGVATDLYISNTVFDGGEIGFVNTAFNASAGAVTRIRGHNVQFLRGADFAIHASSTGYFDVSTRTGAITGSW